MIIYYVRGWHISIYGTRIHFFYLADSLYRMVIVQITIDSFIYSEDDKRKNDYKQNDSTYPIY